MERKDDFKQRRAHLKEFTEEQLEARFWKLTEELIDPMIKLAETHTSPSIERSVLLRMGFSSLECKAIVAKAIDHNLLSKGAGHVVYKVAKNRNMEIRDAGLKLADGELWEEALGLFKGGAA